MPAEKPLKKQISDRRRMQNKQAQKNYRERQKRNLQVLQDIATSSHSLRIDGAEKDGQFMEAGMVICTNASPVVDGVYGPSFTRSRLPFFSEAEKVVDSISGSGQSPGTFSGIDKQPQSFPIPRLPLIPESPHNNNIIGRLLEQEGLSFDEETKLQLLEEKITLQSILEAGLKALSRQASSEVVSSTSNRNGEECATNDGTKLRTDKILVLQNANCEYTAPLPDMHRNHIRIQEILYVAACMANASSLGLIPPVENCDDDAESPFFRDSISESAAKTACLNGFTDLKMHLRPCATQLMHRHHPYIDVLPFPTFRERVIKLAYVEEPMIDEDDLCKDLSDGLVCWGSVSGGRSSAIGSGAPWDIQSWEAQPWFLKKWWILIGGAEGEIYKQTQWWREMRGERPCSPW